VRGRGSSLLWFAAMVVHPLSSGMWAKCHASAFKKFPDSRSECLCLAWRLYRAAKKKTRVAGPAMKAAGAPMRTIKKSIAKSALQKKAVGAPKKTAAAKAVPKNKLKRKAEVATAKTSRKNSAESLGQRLRHAAQKKMLATARVRKVADIPRKTAKKAVKASKPNDARRKLLASMILPISGTRQAAAGPPSKPDSFLGGKDRMLRCLRQDTVLGRQVRRELQTHGFAVVRKAISAGECNSCLRELWKQVEVVTSRTQTPVKRSKPKTWSAAWPASYRSLLHQHYGAWVGGMKARVAVHKWAMRNLFDGKVVGPVVSSLDGFVLERPGLRNGDKNPLHRGFHVDQCPSPNGADDGLKWIQMSVALTDAPEGGAAFACWPGSHRRFGDLTKYFEKPYVRNWHLLSPGEQRLLKRLGHEPKRVPANAGDIILWDSRLVHEGASAVSSEASTALRHGSKVLPLGCAAGRAAVFVCLMPKFLVPPHVMSLKCEAFKNGDLQTTTHQPDMYKTFPKKHIWLERKVRGLRVVKQPKLSVTEQRILGVRP